MADTICTTRRTLLKAGLGAVAALAAGCDGRRSGTAPDSLHEFRGPTMGSSYTVKIVERGLSAAGQAAAHAAVVAALEEVEWKMSTYRPDSELSRLNRHAAERPLGVSPALAQVLARSAEVSAASNGAFDVTIGPLVNAWGFGPPGRTRLPSAEEIAELRERVDWRSIALDPAIGTARKARPDAYVDLSGIAQGFGADRVAAALEAHGFGDFLVDVSGEVRAQGVNAEGVPWRIGIERPDAPDRMPHLVVPLAGQALATSGDYRNWFEHDGRRYSHEIDPALGAPVTHRLASVSVVHADCALADAWATALFVLGPERGLAAAEREGLAAYFITRAPGGFVEHQTPAFAALGGRPTAG
jgi:thiamine biosynthesis lipoprotein